MVPTRVEVAVSWRGKRALLGWSRERYTCGALRPIGRGQGSWTVPYTDVMLVHSPASQGVAAMAGGSTSSSNVSSRFHGRSGFDRIPHVLVSSLVPGCNPGSKGILPITTSHERTPCLPSSPFFSLGSPSPSVLLFLSLYSFCSSVRLPLGPFFLPSVRSSTPAPPRVRGFVRRTPPSSLRIALRIAPAGTSLNWASETGLGSTLRVFGWRSVRSWR
eukprot:scaffold239_cov382-Pavlova_lutheri.AAC.4